jgi:hypothetical protein
MFHSVEHASQVAYLESLGNSARSCSHCLPGLLCSAHSWGGVDEDETGWTGQ